MSSNIERNAEIDARHAKEPETEFSYGIDETDAAALYALLGQLDCGVTELTDFTLALEDWLEKNHPGIINSFQVDLLQAIKFTEITP